MGSPGMHHTPSPDAMLLGVPCLFHIQRGPHRGASDCRVRGGSSGSSVGVGWQSGSVRFVTSTAWFMLEYTSYMFVIDGGE